MELGMPNYRVRMAGSKAAEIYLYDEIGGGMWGGGISAKQFAEDLKSLGKIDTLNVRVNSPGGDVFDGLAIYSTLKRHPANVVMDIDGMALSIASVIVMAGNQVNMAKNAMMMIHDPWTCSCGTADDFRKQADLMDQVKGNLVTTYADRTKMDEAEIADLMSAETWLTADDALSNGFVDGVTEDLQLAARFDLSRFRNAPKALARAQPRPVGTDIFRSKIAALASRAKQISGH
jgi:ATP-dependent Clp protease, protease subunit